MNTHNIDPCLLVNATRIALLAHGHALRKDGQPYLCHPVAVWRELVRAGIGDPHLHALALVHDVLEESADEAAVFRGRIRDGLGAPLLADLEWLTDDPALSSAERKALQLHKFRAAPWAAKVVKLADRVANLASAPPQWGAERCLAYAAHSQQLLALLRGTHSGLEARLSERLQSAPWCPGKSAINPAL